MQERVSPHDWVAELGDRCFVEITPGRFGHSLKLVYGLFGERFRWVWGSADRADRVARRWVEKTRAEMARVKRSWTVGED